MVHLGRTHTVRTSVASSGAATDRSAADRRADPQPTAASDVPLYVATAVVLVAVGALVRTWLLNWVCGPAFVVAGVTGLGALRDRLRRRAATR
jgi:hypothetical protein